MRPWCGLSSDQNSKLWWYRKSRVLQGNYSKKSISRSNRNSRPYPLRLSLVYTSPTCGQNLSSKAFYHLGRFPRQSFHLKWEEKKLFFLFPSSEINIDVDNDHHCLMKLWILYKLISPYTILIIQLGCLRLKDKI